MIITELNNMNASAFIISSENLKKFPLTKSGTIAYERLKSHFFYCLYSRSLIIIHLSYAKLVQIFFCKNHF